MADLHPILGTASSFTVSGTTFNGGYQWSYNGTTDEVIDTNFSTTSGTKSYLPGLPIDHKFTVVGEVLSGDTTFTSLNPGSSLTNVVLYCSAGNLISGAAAVVTSVDMSADRRTGGPMPFTINGRFVGAVTKTFA